MVRAVFASTRSAPLRPNATICPSIVHSGICDMLIDPGSPPFEWACRISFHRIFRT